MYEHHTPAATAIRVTLDGDDIMKLISHLAGHGTDGTFNLDVRAWTKSDGSMAAEIAIEGSLGEIFECEDMQASIKTDGPEDDDMNPLAVVHGGSFDQQEWNAWTN